MPAVRMPSCLVRRSRISNSCLKSLLVTNSIPLKEEARRCEKITVLSVGALLGEAISRIHNEDSVSYLFV